MTVAVRTLADDVWDLIDGIANLNAYRSEVPQSTDPDVPIPPVDPDGRVHPYVVVHFGAGTTTSNRVCASPNQTTWSVLIWCVGGDDNRCLWAVDQIRAVLDGTLVAGGTLRQLFAGGTDQRDDVLQPARTSLPVEFRLYVCG